MKRSRRVSQKTILWGRRWAGASSWPQDEKTRNHSLRRCRMLQFRTYDAAEWQEPFPLCPLRSTAIRSPRTPKNDGMQRAGAADRCHDLFVKWMMDDWLIDTHYWHYNDVTVAEYQNKELARRRIRNFDISMILRQCKTFLRWEEGLRRLYDDEEKQKWKRKGISKRNDTSTNE